MIKFECDKCKQQFTSFKEMKTIRLYEFSNLEINVVSAFVKGNNKIDLCNNCFDREIEKLMEPYPKAVTVGNL